jgi:hypothetical protein
VGRAKWTHYAPVGKVNSVLEGNSLVTLEWEAGGWWPNVVDEGAMMCPSHHMVSAVSTGTAMEAAKPSLPKLRSAASEVEYSHSDTP